MYFILSNCTHYAHKNMCTSFVYYIILSFINIYNIRLEKLAILIYKLNVKTVYTIHCNFIQFEKNKNSFAIFLFY